MGRFTSRDPMLQFWTPYSYVGNAPLTGIDPDGLVDLNLLGKGINLTSAEMKAEQLKLYYRAEIPDKNPSVFSVAIHSLKGQLGLLGPDYLLADNPGRRFATPHPDYGVKAEYAAMYVSELVDYIKSDPGYKEGMKVQLGACFTGSNGVAQAVANMLGTSVQAPKHWVDLRADGSLQPISEDKSMIEPWLTFLPETKLEPQLTK